MKGKHDGSKLESTYRYGGDICKGYIKYKDIYFLTEVFFGMIYFLFVLADLKETCDSLSIKDSLLHLQQNPKVSFNFKYRHKNTFN